MTNKFMSSFIDPTHPYFFSAIQSGNLNYFHQFVLEGNDINCKTRNNHNALHYAIKTENDSLVELLIQLGVDVNLQNHKGETPLHFISRDLSDSLKSSYLHLINAEANFNIINKEGETPLHLAIKRNNYEIVKLFVESGADIHTSDIFDQSMVHLSTNTSDFNILQLLIEHGAPLENKNSHNIAPLHFACQRIDQTHTQLLIDAGANPNIQDGDGNTPLHLALTNRNSSIDILLKQSLNFSLSNKYGENVFHLAAEFNSLEVFIQGMKTPNFYYDLNLLNDNNENVLDVAKAYHNNKIIDFIQTYFEYYNLKNSTTYLNETNQPSIKMKL